MCDICLEEPCKLDAALAEMPPIDMVHAPPHYKLNGLDVEWIDVRSALLRSIQSGVPYEAVTSWSEAISYLARMWGKNGVEDAKKAKFYVARMIAIMEGELPCQP